MISATYFYGALVFSPDSRGVRLSIFDGTDMVASIVGSVLAPIIKNNIGLYACFGLKLIVSSLSLIYGIFCVKEPTKDIQDCIGCAIEKILHATNFYKFISFLFMI